MPRSIFTTGITTGTSKIRSVRLATAFACLALSVVLGGWAQSGDDEARFAPVAVCASTDWPPLIDGRLDDTAWRDASYLGPFVRVGTHEAAAEATSCRVIRGEEFLYVAFECLESQMADIKTDAAGRDHRRAWADDCVHVFLASGDPRQTYFHVIVTARGLVFDERVLDDGRTRDPGWDGEILAAAEQLPDRWTAEVAIRLADIAGDDRIAGSWRFSVARAEHPQGEWSSWSLLNASLHEFDKFGRLIWAPGPVVTGMTLTSPFLGHNECRVSVGAASEPFMAELQVLREGTLHTKKRFRIAANASTSFGYEVQAEGLAAVRLILRHEYGHALLYASPPMAFDIPTVRSAIRAAFNTLGAAATLVRDSAVAPVKDALLEEIGGVRDRAESLAREAERLAARGQPPHAEWQALHERVVAMEPQVRVAQLKSGLAGMGIQRVPSFALGTETSLRKLLPGDCSYNTVPELSLQCARRERESGQVVVASLGETVNAVRVDWSELKHTDGSVIGRDAIEVHRVGYVTTRTPVYDVDHVGRWPDPLMPLTSFDVPANEIQPLWVTVSMPADAKPGRYTGEISVSTEIDGEQIVTLAVDVWDLELPLHGRFKTGFGNAFYGDVREWYGFGNELPEEFRHELYGLMLKNRVNPAGLYIPGAWPLLDDFDWCYERGLNALCLGNLESASPERLAQLAEAAEFLRRRDLLDIGYVYGFGILSEDDAQRAREALSRVRDAIPGLKRACPIHPTQELWGYANIWGALTSSYDHLTAQRRRRVGEEVWWYVCCGPRHPYGNFYIDYPAMDARTLFWAAYKYDVTGFFYYEVAMWASNMVSAETGEPSIVIHDDPEALTALREGRRWPEVPWNTFTFSRYNGDGLLIYPGPNKTPLPSLRLELIRDGIEDYELLALLDGLAEELRARDTNQEYSFLVDEAKHLTSVRNDVVRDLASFTHDPQIIEEERSRVAKQALRIQQILRRFE